MFVIFFATNGKTMKKKWLTIGLTSIGIGGLALLIWSKIGRTKSMVSNLVFTPMWYGNLDDMKVDTQGVKCPLAIKFGNRSDESIDIRLNSFDLVNKSGKTVASSATGNYTVSIKPYEESTMPVDVWVTTSSVVSLLKSVIISITEKDASAMKKEAKSLIEDATVKASVTINNVLTVDVSVPINGTETIEDTNATQGTEGMGIVSAEKRIIGSLYDYIDLIPPSSELRRADKIISGDKNITPEETAIFIRKVAKSFKGDTELLSWSLKRATIPDTVQCIWNFVAKYIKYVQDSKQNEQVRRPLRTLYDQEGDCDCYTALIASICENLGLNYKIRIAEYANRGYYQHVYPVIEGYVCDVVYTACFREKTPTRQMDF